MKKLLFYTLFMFSMLHFSFAQKGKKIEEPKPVTAVASQNNTDQAKKIYRNALSYNDFATATYAAHQIIVLEGENSTWLDTLGRLYFSQSNNISVLLVAEKILTKDPQNRDYLELKAVAFGNLGAAKESLEAYEKLFAISKDVRHLYQVASIQFHLKRLGEAEMTAKQVVEHVSSPSDKVSLFYADRQNLVVAKAAGYNLLGAIAMEQIKKAEAKNYFELALKIAPDFDLPKNNIEELNKK
jgi:tetratricopeptide (TPR) repeat protein